MLQRLTLTHGWDLIPWSGPLSCIHIKAVSYTHLLVTESTSIPRTDYTRNAVAEVDGVIDSDLVYAMSNLPVVGAANCLAIS